MGVRNLEANWQLAVPDGLVCIEHHAQNTFRGGSHRFEVLRAERAAWLTGTFFDPSSMNRQDLTQAERILVNRVHGMFQPEHAPDFSLPGWLKNSAAPRGSSSPNEGLLCLHNEESDLFFVYENLP